MPALTNSMLCLSSFTYIYVYVHMYIYLNMKKISVDFQEFSQNDENKK